MYLSVFIQSMVRMSRRRNNNGIDGNKTSDEEKGSVVEGLTEKKTANYVR